MESEITFAVEESPEGDYEARALGHSIYTQAQDLDELRELVQDAVRCHFDPEDRPKLIRLHIVKDELIPVRSFRVTSPERSWRSYFTDTGMR